MGPMAWAVTASLGLSVGYAARAQSDSDREEWECSIAVSVLGKLDCAVLRPLLLTMCGLELLNGWVQGSCAVLLHAVTVPIARRTDEQRIICADSDNVGTIRVRDCQKIV